MTKKHVMQVFVWCILSCLLFPLSSCVKKEARGGSINAAVGNTCGTVLNFSGSNVFAYKVTSGPFTGMLLVGGYHTGDVKELGFYLPWSGIPATYSMIGGNSGYYDPTNSGVGANQYGTTGSGTVTISGISIDGDNVTVNGITVSFENIQMQNPTGENICINNGTISF